MKSHNEHSRTLLFILTISMLLASSCSPSAIATEQPTATVASSATISAFADTPTPLPTIEAVPTPTIQPTTELSPAQECIPIEEKIPDDLHLSGVWVRNRGIPYLETVDGRTAYEVPLKGGGLFSTRTNDMAVSPNGKYLAYIDTYIREDGKSADNRVLRIIKSSGHSLPMDYWVENWQSIMGWADGETLVLLTSGSGIVVLNPFTGEWKKFQEPEWVKYDSDYWRLPPYNPTLEWVLIRRPEPWILNLVNVQNGETAWSRNTFKETTWSTNGTTLVVLSNEKIEFISNGKLTVNTDSRQLEIDDFIFGMKLSPDNKNLIVISYPNNLYLVKVNESKFSILCDHDFSINSYENPLAWSPDSRFVVLEMYGPNYREQFDLLIDTQPMKAYKLISGQYQHRLAWLAQP